MAKRRKPITIEGFAKREDVPPEPPRENETALAGLGQMETSQVAGLGLMLILAIVGIIFFAGYVEYEDSDE
jgi:hypothetical protein